MTIRPVMYDALPKEVKVNFDDEFHIAADTNDDSIRGNVAIVTCLAAYPFDSGQLPLAIQPVT